jgi:hypothetical protein
MYVAELDEHAVTESSDVRLYVSLDFERERGSAVAGGRLRL